MDLTFKNVFFFTATTVARATPTTTAATTTTATEQAEIGRIFGNYFLSFHSSNNKVGKKVGKKNLHEIIKSFGSFERSIFLTFWIEGCLIFVLFLELLKGP